MHDFISFLERRDGDLWLSHYETISEMSMAEIEAREPKDGKWVDDTHYGFNVEGDDCDGLVQNNCYMVSFDGPSTNPSISFYRYTVWGYRPNIDVDKGYGNQVLNGVQFAILQYIKKNRPDALSWVPLQTNRVNPKTKKITNREGRRDVYEILSLKSLFPEFYVSPDINRWVRRDIYDNDYVRRGYPEIPRELTNSSKPSEKKQFLNKIRAFYKAELANFYNQTPNLDSVRQRQEDGSSGTTSSTASNIPSRSNPTPPIENRPDFWWRTNFWVRIGPCEESGEIYVHSEHGKTGDVVFAQDGLCAVRHHIDRSRFEVPRPLKPTGSDRYKVLEDDVLYGIKLLEKGPSGIQIPDTTYARPKNSVLLNLITRTGLNLEWGQPIPKEFLKLYRWEFVNTSLVYRAHESGRNRR